MQSTIAGVDVADLMLHHRFMLPKPGQVLAGRYELGRVIGQGGMGLVFEARQLDLPRSVAVKVFSVRDADAIDLARFGREVSILARLSHPHVVQVIDFFGGDAHTPPMLVMELLRGQTLAELVRSRGPLDAPHAVRIVAQLLDALAAAHAEGILHRDVKPANVFCVETELGAPHVKLLDFGVAKDTNASRVLTATGDLVGTLTYMAPELHRGEPPSARSEIFAVGATLYFALTGKSPFSRRSAAEITAAIMNGAIEPIERLRPETPPRLAAVVRRALDPDPLARFATAAEMHAALREIAVSPPRSRVLLVAIAVVLGLATGTAIFFAMHRRVPTAPVTSIAPAPPSASSAIAPPPSVAPAEASATASSAPAIASSSGPKELPRYSGKHAFFASMNAQACSADYSPSEKLHALPIEKCFTDAVHDPPIHEIAEYDIDVSPDTIRVTPHERVPKLDACMVPLLTTLPRPTQRCTVVVSFRAECRPGYGMTQGSQCP